MLWDNPRTKVANMLAALTGMRLEEILGLLRTHVHPEDGFIFVKTFVVGLLEKAYQARKGGLIPHIVPVYDKGEARALDNFLKKFRSSK